jgi:hypothetical protein
MFWEAEKQDQQWAIANNVPHRSLVESPQTIVAKRIFNDTVWLPSPAISYIDEGPSGLRTAPVDRSPLQPDHYWRGQHIRQRRFLSEPSSGPDSIPRWNRDASAASSCSGHRLTAKHYSGLITGPVRLPADVLAEDPGLPAPSSHPTRSGGNRPNAAWMAQTAARHPVRHPLASH